MIHRSALSSELFDDGLKLHDIHAFDRRNRCYPASGRTGAQADHGGGSRMWVRQCCEQTGHYLRTSVGFRVAVAFAVDDETESVGLGNADAALDSVCLPQNIAAQRMQQVVNLIGCGTVLLHPIQLAMTPDSCRAGSEN